MTYYEAIKCMNEDALANFIMHLEIGMSTIPKKYFCDEMYCINCKEHLSCYKNYLKQEVRDYTAKGTNLDSKSFEIRIDPKYITDADDIKSDDEWMQENEWDEIYKEEKLNEDKSN